MGESRPQHSLDLPMIVNSACLAYCTAVLAIIASKIFDTLFESQQGLKSMKTKKAQLQC